MVSGSRNNSRTKAQGKKPIVLAKDPKQAALAIVVVILFIIVSISNIIKYVKENSPHPAPITQQTTATSTTMPPGYPGDPTNVQPPTTPNEQLVQQQGNAGDLADPNQTQSSPQASNQIQPQAQDANNIYNQALSLQKGKNALKNEAKKIGIVKGPNSDIEILPQKTTQKFMGKMVSITVNDTGRSCPFLPIEEVSGPSHSSFSYLPAPPDKLPSNTDASKIISTVISGILYDKYNPSAIINIEGTDYLVKKGDTINNYKILSISRSQVVVQLGRNVYQAGVGELLSLSDLKSSVANLNKKFGGNNVSISVRKKGY